MVTPLDFVGQFRIRHFVGLVKFAFDSESVDDLLIYIVTCTLTKYYSGVFPGGCLLASKFAVVYFPTSKFVFATFLTICS